MHRGFYNLPRVPPPYIVLLLASLCTLPSLEGKILKNPQYYYLTEKNVSKVLNSKEQRNMFNLLPLLPSAQSTQHEQNLHMMLHQNTKTSS
jgi:hypothetical protein